ncbi:MAG: hypothetical protein RBU37_26315 [Myxococcota bacterium]|jgi:hypothetical protein|nr:hypothetical protein [Myxococcota bacterium]
MLMDARALKGRLAELVASQTPPEPFEWQDEHSLIAWDGQRLRLRERADQELWELVPSERVVVKLSRTRTAPRRRREAPAHALLIELTQGVERVAFRAESQPELLQELALLDSQATLIPFEIAESVLRLLFAFEASLAAWNSEDLLQPPSRKYLRLRLEQPYQQRGLASLKQGTLAFTLALLAYAALSVFIVLLMIMQNSMNSTLRLWLTLYAVAMLPAIWAALRFLRLRQRLELDADGLVFWRWGGRRLPWSAVESARPVPEKSMLFLPLRDRSRSFPLLIPRPELLHELAGALNQQRGLLENHMQRVLEKWGDWRHKVRWLLPVGLSMIMAVVLLASHAGESAHRKASENLERIDQALEKNDIAQARAIFDQTKIQGSIHDELPCRHLRLNLALLCAELKVNEASQLCWDKQDLIRGDCAQDFPAGQRLRTDLCLALNELASFSGNSPSSQLLKRLEGWYVAEWEPFLGPIRQRLQQLSTTPPPSITKKPRARQ